MHRCSFSLSTKPLSLCVIFLNHFFHALLQLTEGLEEANSSDASPTCNDKKVPIVFFFKCNISNFKSVNCTGLSIHTIVMDAILAIQFNMFWFELLSQQDPTSLDKFNLANFHHLKNNLKVVNEGQFYIHGAIKVSPMKFASILPASIVPCMRM